MTRNEFDPAGPLERRRVLRQFVRTAFVLNLHVQGQIIGTTTEHPFYVRLRDGDDAFNEQRRPALANLPGQPENEGWLDARFLVAGDAIASSDGRWIEIESVALSGQLATVYNLEVEGDHTYFVGGERWGWDVWAHNKCNLHHPIPKVVGGNATQHLLSVDRTLLHMPFHSLFQANLNAAGIAIHTMGGMSKARVLAYFASNPGSQREMFSVLIRTARDFDAAHGTQFLSFVKHNIVRGNWARIGW